MATEPLYTTAFPGSIPMSDSTASDADMAALPMGCGGEEALRSGRRGRTFESCRPDFESLSAASEGLSPGEVLLAEGVDNPSYHRLPCPSKSSAWDFRFHGPSWYEGRYVTREIPGWSTAATTLGTLVHAALELGGPAYRAAVKIVPGQFATAAGALSSTKEAKAWVADQGPDALIATPSDAAIVEGILREFFRNSAARALYEDASHHELSAVHRRDDGHLVRCRYDMVTHGGRIVDWKTTRDARPLNTFHKAVATHGYHYASAWYSLIARAAGISDERLTFVTLSTTGHHDVQVVTLPERIVARCEQWIADDLEELAARLDSGVWLPHGYGEEHELVCPDYLFREVA
jgi:hypothetical protein